MVRSCSLLRNDYRLWSTETSPTGDPAQRSQPVFAADRLPPEKPPAPDHPYRPPDSNHRHIPAATLRSFPITRVLTQAWTLAKLSNSPHRHPETFAHRSEWNAPPAFPNSSDFTSTSPTFTSPTLPASSFLSKGRYSPNLVELPLFDFYLPVSESWKSPRLLAASAKRSPNDPLGIEQTLLGAPITLATIVLKADARLSQAGGVTRLELIIVRLFKRVEMNLVSG
jgi:hypothetical protein